MAWRKSQVYDCAMSKRDYRLWRLTYVGSLPRVLFGHDLLLQDCYRADYSVGEKFYSTFVCRYRRPGSTRRDHVVWVRVAESLAAVNECAADAVAIAALPSV